MKSSEYPSVLNNTKTASEDEWVNAPPTLDELIGDLGIHHFNGLSKTSIRVKYNALMKLYNSGKAITVYRALSAADIGKIKREGFGTFWSWSEDGAKVYYPETEGDPTHVFQGEVDRDDVDWYQTCSMLANSEREIRVQDGAQVSIIGWRRDGETAWQGPPPEMKVVTASARVQQVP